VPRHANLAAGLQCMLLFYEKEVKKNTSPHLAILKTFSPLSRCSALGNIV
jgi:hypothetical protein